MASTMRAKVRLASVNYLDGGAEVLKFHAVAKTGAYPHDGADEDNTYAKYSPSATFEITVMNPALAGKFIPGERYYVDFTPTE